MKKVGTYILILTMLVGIISCVTFASESTGTGQDGAASILAGTTSDHSNLQNDTLNDPNLLGYHGEGGPGGRPGGHGRHRRHGGPEGPGGFGDGFVLLFAALAVIVLLGCSEHSDY
jgi:hypothetical protein